MDHTKYNLSAEPPSPRGIEEFHTDSPAFLLTKIDNDELLHLLESQPGTPFESPRLESHLRDDSGAILNIRDSKLPIKSRAKLGPPPILARPDPFVVPPKALEDDIQSPKAQRPTLKGGSAVLRDENEFDASLQGPWQDFNGVKWSVSHAKLLYLISLYADGSIQAESSVWLRQLHLMALIHECIQDGLFGFRCVPESTIILGDGEPFRLWLNVPPGGVQYLNDLCSSGLLNCLRISDISYINSTAYQVSSSGQQFVQVFPNELKSRMDAVLRGPLPFQSENVLMQFSGVGVKLTTPGGFERLSKMRDCQRIPFVTSPYIPVFLRFTDKPGTDNSGMASQCALWNEHGAPSTLQVMCFGNMTIVLAEFLPVGPNLIQAVSETLGSSDRAGSGGCFMLPYRGKRRMRAVNFTSTTLLDCGNGIHVNYEANVCVQDFQDPHRIKHIEEFGVHIRQDGTVLSGVQVEAVSDKEWDDISLDLIAKVICELQADSNVVVDNVYPETLYNALDCLFSGKESQRIKYVYFIADQVEPRFPAKQYLDNGKYQRELSSVIGDLTAAEELGDGDMVLFGSRGFFVIGPHAREHEPVCVAYAGFRARNQFLDQLHRRVCCLSDSLGQLHELLRNVEGDQERLMLLNTRILESSSDYRNLNTILNHFFISLDTTKLADRPKSTPGRVFYDYLRFRILENELVDRANDMQILLRRVERELTCLTDLASFEERKNLAGSFSDLQRQTLHLGRERGSLVTHSGRMILQGYSAVKFLIIAFAGLLAADILDRLHSGFLVSASTPRWFVDTAGVINAQPWVLLVVQTFLIAVFCVAVARRAAMLESRSVCCIRRKIDLNVKVLDMQALFKLLDRKGCSRIVYSAKLPDSAKGRASVWSETGIMHATFVEKTAFRWYGDPPRVTLEVDVVNGWVTTAEYVWGFWSEAPAKAALREQLLETLSKAGVT